MFLLGIFGNNVLILSCVFLTFQRSAFIDSQGLGRGRTQGKGLSESALARRGLGRARATVSRASWRSLPVVKVSCVSRSATLGLTRRPWRRLRPGPAPSRCGSSASFGLSRCQGFPWGRSARRCAVSSRGAAVAGASPVSRPRRSGHGWRRRGEPGAASAAGGPVRALTGGRRGAAAAAGHPPCSPAAQRTPSAAALRLLAAPPPRTWLCGCVQG